MSWGPRGTWLAWCVVASAMSAAPAVAQTVAPGVVAGRVTDDSGGLLPGVAVTLVARDGERKTLAVTGADGRFEVGALAPGIYRFSCTAFSFSEFRRADVHVTAGDRTIVDVTMHLAMASEVIVRGARTLRQLGDLPRPQENLVGLARAASEGAVTASQLDARPVSRVGEILESVPGLIVSQHSGEGKANQYYLRGFNLDHGTDFSTSVSGVPVNLPSHAHGHGYSDLNFLIPELVSGVQFRKGPYYAAQGDFSSAGSAQINYVNVLERSLVNASTGQNGWRRLLAAASPTVAGGPLLVAIDVSANDGPWVRPDEYRKIGGLVRFTRGALRSGLSLTGMFYDGRWNATDQIPARSVSQGVISRFGALDESTGGESSRHSVSGEYLRTGANSQTKVTAYVMRYRLKLFSNFTYALDDPERGDQFEQSERRWVSGSHASYARLGSVGGRAAEHEVGVDLRYDSIPTIGLYRTQARARHTTVREDAIRQGSGGVYAQTEVHWQPWLRTTQGLRLDGYGFDVRAGDTQNGGRESAFLASPKFSAAFGPWRATEIYVNGGGGFHSNDARGTTIRRDPSSGEAVQPVTPLVRATGAEVGLRSVLFPRMQVTASAWYLALASELLFIGDAGTTQAGRPSRRAGIEVGAYLRLNAWLSADADLSWSRARFNDDDPAGRFVPGAASAVASAGVIVDQGRGVSGSLRVRHFGPRNLVEDGRARSRPTTLVNGQAGFALARGSRVVLDISNLLNQRVSDIDYLYTSRLPGEAAGGVEDIHTHPALPRTARISLRIGF